VTVEQHNTVDFVSFDRDKNPILTIADHMSWAAPKDHLWDLQEKLNAYLRFLESGEIFQKFPDAHGRQARIHIALLHAIPPENLWFFEKAESAVEKAGFRFSFALGPQP